MASLKSVDQQIAEAMAQGKFDNLPGKGKPIDLDSYFKTPEHLRMAFHILKDAGFLPPEIELKKEIESLRAERHATQDDAERRRLDQEINKKTAVYDTSLEQLRSVD